MNTWQVTSLLVHVVSQVRVCVCDPRVRPLLDDKTWLHVLNSTAELRSEALKPMLNPHEGIISVVTWKRKMNPMIHIS